MPHRLVLLGPPASGKGTQGRIMAARWQDCRWFRSGDDAAPRDRGQVTRLGLEAARYLDRRRQLVPDKPLPSPRRTVEGWLGSNRDPSFRVRRFSTHGRAGASLGRRCWTGVETLRLMAVVWLDLDDAAASNGARQPPSHLRRIAARSFQLGTRTSPEPRREMPRVRRQADRARRRRSRGARRPDGQTYRERTERR